MSHGVAQAAYPLWFVLAFVCCTVSGGMLAAAEREGMTSQAWRAPLLSTLQPSAVACQHFSFSSR